jgi:hypothetical protein
VYGQLLKKVNKQRKQIKEKDRKAVLRERLRFAVSLLTKNKHSSIPSPKNTLQNSSKIKKCNFVQETEKMEEERRETKGKVLQKYRAMVNLFPKNPPR